MTTWAITYDSIRDGAAYVNGTITAASSDGLTADQACTAVVEHHRADGVDASHVWVMRIEAVA